MAGQKRAAIYASELIGVNGERPELENLIQRAATKPRPFDVVIVQRMDMLGSPDDIRDAVARLGEFGVTVETARK